MKETSPSRLYVLMVDGEDGTNFDMFQLPETYENNNIQAREYFINKVDRERRVKHCFPYECLVDIKEYK